MGPYEIKSAIGVGGMGEVYRAHDSRLNRDVAIKVLRQDAAAGPGQRSRFEREAQALAALNHPNIVVVHDFGFDNGQPYIVSEIVEGESLRSLLDGKPMPARKLVDIAAQIADGLAAAHTAGIVHRDLKPENIMVTRDGRVKILDFGLARQTAAADNAETIGLDATQHVTREGAVVGTASYMSPEQAAGKPVDFRTDQFSLGLILYELASGHRAFSAPSVVETMAAIVREDPPPIEEKLPAPLRWIMDRCLAKEPEQRYESTRDLSRDLRSLRDHFSDAWSSGSSSVGLAPVPAARKHSRWWIIAVAVSVVCLLVGALLAWVFKPVGQQIGNYRYTPFAANALYPSWSLDGKAVAYTARVNGVEQSFLRYLDSPVPVQLTHEPKDTMVVGWSSDRNHLIVLQRTDLLQGKLESVPTVGGDLEFMMNANCRVCDVSRDGKAFAELAPGPNPGDLWDVYISDPIGSPLRAYAPAPFASHAVDDQPALVFSPDGKKILLIFDGDNGKQSAWILPLPAGSQPPHQVLHNLPTFGGAPAFSWLPDNRHIMISLVTAQDAPPAHLWIADTESNDLEPLTTGSQFESDPTLSPDGKRLLYSQVSSSYDVISVSLTDGSATVLESTGREESMPAWAANSSELAWVSHRNGPFEIWLRSADGSERPVVTAAQFPDDMNRWLMNPTLSPDGKTLVFTRIAKDGVCRLWIMSLAGGSPVRLTNVEPGCEYAGVWSPDGSRFAYLQTGKSGASLMVVRASGDANPAPIEKRENGAKAGYLPAWSPDGNWITWHDAAGWQLVSPSGKSSKFLGDLPTPYLAFSKDGKLLYGIQTVPTAAELNDLDFGADRAVLFSIDPATLRQHVIRDLGKDLIPKSNFIPGIRFSLSPDGKSIAYATGKSQSNLWMLQGFQLPGAFGRF